MPLDDDYKDDDAPANGDDNESSGSEQATTQMCPLDLRFSQRKMRNVFADGGLIADSAELVKAVRRTPSEEDIYGAQWKLEAPFPPIEVLRWRCKLRDETTGRPLTDPKTGKELYEPEESWFTLDNRRLYCLQIAAMRKLPDRCTADAVAEIRKERRMREIRKFRTQDGGLSIEVGSVVDGVPFTRWCWRTDAARGAQGIDKGGKPAKGVKGGGKGQNSKNGKGNDQTSVVVDKDDDYTQTGHAKGGRKGKGKRYNASKGGDYYAQSDYYYYYGHGDGYYEEDWNEGWPNPSKGGDRNKGGKRGKATKGFKGSSDSYQGWQNSWQAHG